MRLSVFDMVPYRKRADGVGEPEPESRSVPGFSVLASDDGLESALEESRGVLRMLEGLGVRWICATAGSPYYNPHIQRPAMFPPLDGYEPPEDPLRGVARQIQATALLKRDFPGLVFVGSAYSYLQEWLPHVGQHNVREGLCDFVGLGRIVLSYPDLPADVLAGAPLRRNAFCRTFSDCTTGPRMGLVSGCYPARSVLRGAAGSGEDQGCAHRITCGVGRPVVTAQPDGTQRPQRPQRSRSKVAQPLRAA